MDFRTVSPLLRPVQAPSRAFKEVRVAKLHSLSPTNSCIAPCRRIQMLSTTQKR